MSAAALANSCRWILDSCTLVLDSVTCPFPYFMLLRYDEAWVMRKLELNIPILIRSEPASETYFEVSFAAAWETQRIARKNTCARCPATCGYRHVNLCNPAKDWGTVWFFRTQTTFGPGVACFREISRIGTELTTNGPYSYHVSAYLAIQMHYMIVYTVLKDQVTPCVPSLQSSPLVEGQNC